MKGFLSDKKAVLAGAVSAVVLTVMRIIQLVSAPNIPRSCMLTAVRRSIQCSTYC